jgi:hypothetical protein
MIIKIIITIIIISNNNNVFMLTMINEEIAMRRPM